MNKQDGSHRCSLDAVAQRFLHRVVFIHSSPPVHLMWSPPLSWRKNLRGGVVLETDFPQGRAVGEGFTAGVTAITQESDQGLADDSTGVCELLIPCLEAQTSGRLQRACAEPPPHREKQVMHFPASPSSCLCGILLGARKTILGTTGSECEQRTYACQ
jgi:hypothetical protein